MAEYIELHLRFCIRRFGPCARRVWKSARANEDGRSRQPRRLPCPPSARGRGGVKGAGSAPSGRLATRGMAMDGETDAGGKGLEIRDGEVGGE